MRSTQKGALPPCHVNIALLHRVEEYIVQQGSHLFGEPIPACQLRLIKKTGCEAFYSAHELQDGRLPDEVECISLRADSESKRTTVAILMPPFRGAEIEVSHDGPQAAEKVAGFLAGAVSLFPSRSPILYQLLHMRFWQYLALQILLMTTEFVAIAHGYEVVRKVASAGVWLLALLCVASLVKPYISFDNTRNERKELACRLLVAVGMGILSLDSFAPEIRKRLLGF